MAEPINATSLGKKAGNPIGAASGIISPEAMAKVAAEAGVSSNPPAVVPEQVQQTQSATQAQQAPESIIIKNPFGEQVITPTQTQQTQQGQLTPEAFMAMVNETLGTNLASLEDVASTVVKPFVDLRDGVTKKAELEARLNTVANILAGMPDDMRVVFNAFLNGEDYQGAMNTMVRSKQIDFKRKFEDQDPRVMVNHYSGRNISKEDWDTMDSGVKDMLITSTKTVYSAESAKVNQLSGKSDTINQRQQAVIDSVEASVANLKQLYPTMSKDRLEEIRRTMYTSVNSRLYNNDGTYKPSAAVDIATMLYGQEAISAQTATINQLMDKAMSAGIGKGFERAVSLSDNTPQHKGGGGAAPDQVIAKEVQKSTGFLRSGTPGQRY